MTGFLFQKSLLHFVLAYFAHRIKKMDECWVVKVAAGDIADGIYNNLAFN